jgi:myosin heavy chain 9/10/11/14
MPGNVVVREHARNASPGTFTPKFIAHSATTSRSSGSSVALSGVNSPGSHNNSHKAINNTNTNTNTNTTGSDAARDIAEFSGKRWVWLPDDEHAFVKGWVVEDRVASLVVRCDRDPADRTISSQQVDKVNPPKFNLADDMADLTYLNEASVIHNLRQRYEADLIYVKFLLPSLVIFAAHSC